MEDRKRIGIRVGDTVRVWQKVHEEKDKTRLQSFEGVVLARKHGDEPGATFTVRRTNDPYGAEKIFPLYSSMIDKIEIIKRARVGRAKLYHIREKAARQIKRQMRNLRFVDITTQSDTQESNQDKEDIQVKPPELKKDISAQEAEGAQTEADDNPSVAVNGTPEEKEEKSDEK